MSFNSVKRADDLVPVRHVLASTYDKTGLADFVRGILEASPGVRFYSTGGTFDLLAATLGHGAHLVKVSDYTGQPEMKGGLVKTLDWKIYLGLLAETGDADHQADLDRHGAVAFDMVIANLYPFAQAAADPSAAPEELRQRIDIGGPCMIRASAKNYLRIASVSSPAQYAAVLDELRSSGGRTRLQTRARLAAESFDLTSRFDQLVATRLASLDAESVAAAYGL
jgi:phosphoribosylaminoimidazolecarboxamide formyltransferase/IMP cyclohydrolase